MKTKMFVTMLLALFLSSCVSSPKPVVNHGSDLEVLSLGIQQLAKNRTPQGDIQRMEDAKDSGEVYNYGLDLEDVNWLHWEDKKAIVEFTVKSVEVIKRSREPPCKWRPWRWCVGKP